MPFVQQHEGIRPESCEVCRYLQRHPEFDRRREHTLAMFAGWMLIEDLQALGGPMRTIYAEEYAGASPGVSAPLEPHHWMLALLMATEVTLAIAFEEDDAND